MATAAALKQNGQQPQNQSTIRNAEKITSPSQRRKLYRYGNSDDGVVTFRRAANDNQVLRGTASDDYEKYAKGRANRERTQKKQEERRQRRTREGVSGRERASQSANTKKMLKGSRLRPNARRLRKMTKGKGGVVSMTATVAATSFILLNTTVVYLIQVVFGIAYLAGIAGLETIEDSWWLGILDTVTFSTAENTGLLFMAIGAYGSMLCSVVMWCIAIPIYMARGINIWRGISVPLMGFILALHFIPVFNILPLVWFWCFYIVSTSRKR